MRRDNDDGTVYLIVGASERDLEERPSRGDDIIGAFSDGAVAQAYCDRRGVDEYQVISFPLHKQDPGTRAVFWVEVDRGGRELRRQKTHVEWLDINGFDCAEGYVREDVAGFQGYSFESFDFALVAAREAVKARFWDTTRRETEMRVRREHASSQAR